MTVGCTSGVRYLTSDPIGLYGGLNLYTYVENSPLNAIDPFGLVSKFNPQYWAGYPVVKGRLDKYAPQDVATIPGKTREQTIEILTDKALGEATANEIWKGLLDDAEGKIAGERIKDILKKKHPSWPWDKWDKFWPCLFGGCDKDKDKNGKTCDNPYDITKGR